MKTLWMQGEISGLGSAERLPLCHTLRHVVGVLDAVDLGWRRRLHHSDSVRVDLSSRRCGDLHQAITAASSTGNRPRFSRCRLPNDHAVLAGVIYSACFADVQCWYLSLPYLEIYLVLVILGSAIWLTAVDAERAKRWAFKALVAASVLTMVGLVRYAQTWQYGFWAWQRDVYTAIEPVDQSCLLTPASAVLMRNIPGYFSRRQIINLDGLVNNAVVPYWQARRFEQYLSDAHIGFIYDEKLSMERARQFSQRSPELEEISGHPLTNYAVNTRFLWTLKPAAHAPRKAPPKAIVPDSYGRNTLTHSRSPIGP